MKSNVGVSGDHLAALPPFSKACTNPFVPPWATAALRHTGAVYTRWPPAGTAEVRLRAALSPLRSVVARGAA